MAAVAGLAVEIAEGMEVGDCLRWLVPSVFIPWDFLFTSIIRCYVTCELSSLAGNEPFLSVTEFSDTKSSFLRRTVFPQLGHFSSAGWSLPLQ